MLFHSQPFYTYAYLISSTPNHEQFRTSTHNKKIKNMFVLEYIINGSKL